ncbi:MAG: transposase [Patescibacteria group bacterium]
MRVEPHAINSIVHVINRGTRGLNIVKNEKDKDRFLRSIFLLNDEYDGRNWSELVSTSLYERPKDWPEQKPLVHVLAFTLLPNHFHILLQEIKKGGISKFMQRLCGSMSTAYNYKYKEKGSLFQGSYKGKTIVSESHLLYLPFYILVKNTLECFPGGLCKALANFDEAWKWAKNYEFSSFGLSIKNINCPILNDPEGIILNALKNEKYFKKEAKELLIFYMNNKNEKFKDIMLENW